MKLIALSIVVVLAAGCNQQARDMRNPALEKGYAVAYTTLEGVDPCGDSVVTAIPIEGVRKGAFNGGPFYGIEAKSDAKGNLTLKPERMIAGRYRVAYVRCMGGASYINDTVTYRYAGRALPTFTVEPGKVTAVGFVSVKLTSKGGPTRGPSVGSHSVRPLPATAVASARRKVR